MHGPAENPEVTMTIQATSQATTPARTLTSTVDPKLLDAARQDRVDAVVFFKPVDGANTRQALSQLEAAEALPFGAERKQKAAEALRSVGQATIDANMPVLEQLQKAGGISGVDALWSMNAVRVRGASLEALSKLAKLPVQQIVGDEQISLPTLAPAADAVHGAALVPPGPWQSADKLRKAGKGKGLTPPEDPNTIWMDWGVKKMNAPAAWQQGITGAGIVIASLDTGVIADHPGLKANYRGTKADGTQDHNYNYINVVEKGSTYPIDDVGHGTHTIGSTLSWDEKHLAGVAPDAKFIIGRGLGEAGGSLFGLMAAMEWMMAPTDLNGKNPRPDLAPDVVTNSWGGGPQSNPFLWAQLRNWRRAGIIPVFAAGNNRHANPGEVSSPGMYGETITVGATEKDDSRAYFSMFGPSDYAKDRKPEVTAPGTWTYSTYPDGTYRDTFLVDGKEHPASGTSMATPHVAGAVALYMQAHPNAKFEEINKALQKAGVLYSSPNHEQGYGRVQVDKLITPDSISKDAKLAPKSRVTQLMDQVAAAKVYRSPNAPWDPSIDEPKPGKKAMKAYEETKREREKAAKKAA
jgi:bacillopeptidase F